MSGPATACSVEVIAADLSMLTHRQALVGLLNAYVKWTPPSRQKNIEFKL